jgi:endogenous inhibitor of DNA gyrase (YacG/DUF329 family)
MPKRSIIPYTTTCPHCGQRVLPINLDRHIRTQHPAQAENDAAARKMITLTPDHCPVCQKIVPVYKLAEHIHEYHPEKTHQANASVINKERQEKRKKAIRRKAVENPDFHRTKVIRAAKEKNHLENMARKTAKADKVVYCRYCYQPVRMGEFQAHIDKDHSEAEH